LQGLSKECSSFRDGKGLLTAAFEDVFTKLSANAETPDLLNINASFYETPNKCSESRTTYLFQALVEKMYDVSVDEDDEEGDNLCYPPE